MKRPYGSKWANKKKYKGQEFLGAYEFDKNKDRSFILKAVKGTRVISYESWNAAKKDGWFKI